jgi:hypothetical protein
MATIYSTPTTITITSGSNSGIDAASDWAARSTAAGVTFADNFSKYSTAADWYNRWNQGALVGKWISGSKYPALGSVWDNAWQIVSDTGHVLSGRALRAWMGKNNYGATGTGDLDNQWAAIPFNGSTSNPKAGYMTSFYFQACIWVDAYADYDWHRNDGTVQTSKYFILDYWNSSANTGEVVITNKDSKGFIWSYYSVGAGAFDVLRGTPSNNNNYQWQNAVDNGTPLDNTDASYFRRYGPFNYGMYPGPFSQSKLLHLQGVPNAAAAQGGVAWNRGGITVVEVYVALNTPGNSTVKIWAAPYGSPPKLIVNSTGVNLGSRVGTDGGIGWSGVTLTNLVYQADSAHNPGYPNNAYIDYVEMIVSSNPIKFPGGYALPGA